MIKSGVYQLLIDLPKCKRIRIGNAGYIRFQPGLYIYTGSAKNKLTQRLNRHFSKDKTLFWHIDYLLQYGCIMAYHIEPFKPGQECRLNESTREQLPGSEYVPGFGSSDCKCPSHLIYLADSQNNILAKVYN